EFRRVLFRSGIHLAETIRRRLADVKAGRVDGDREALEIAVGGLSELYGPAVKPAARAGLQKAPSSKVEVLMLAPHWWRTGGRVASLEQLLARYLQIVINSGATATRTGAGADNLRLPATVGDALSGMLLFSLREAMQGVCAGSEDQRCYAAVLTA